MQSVGDPEFSRNYGFWSEPEQRALIESRVALAGVGGDGYLLGLSLIRMGVLHLIAADPEVFEAENVNRVPGATSSRLGRNKAECFLEDARDINPDARLEILTEGVTAENVDRFVDGADLVIDETELTRLELGTMISDASRARRIPVLIVMNIGFAAQAFSFRAEQGPTFRDLMQIPVDRTIDEVAELELDISRCVAYLPPYLDASVLADLATGLSIPSIVQGVNAAAGIGSSQAFLHLVRGVEGSKRPPPVFYPDVMYVDALTGESGIVSDVAAAFRTRVAELQANTDAGLVTELDYSKFA